MAKVGSYGGGPQGANPDDDSTPINKDKFKEQLKKVDAVEKTDPDQKSKKRKPGKEEEDNELAQQALQGQNLPPLGAQPHLGSENQNASPKVSQSPSSSNTANSSNSYTPQGSPAPQGAPFEDSDQGANIPQDIDLDEFDFNDINQTQNSSSDDSSSSQNNTSSQANAWQNNTPETKKPLEAKKTGPLTDQHEKAKKLQKPLTQAKSKDSLEPKLKKPQLQPPSSSSVKKNIAQETFISKKNDDHKQSSFKEVSKPPQPHEQIIASKHETPSTEGSIQPLTKKQKEKKEHKIQEVDSSSSATMGMSPLPIPINGPPPEPMAQTQASYLSPAVHELFQTMVGLVMVKQITNEGGAASLMEIALNNPQYANSKFFGLTIKITEFKSAPGSYNIELIGSSSQTQILETEKIKLISALNDNRYSLPFTVNRLDVSLKKDDKDFLFKRKESVKGDNKDANHK